MTQVRWQLQEAKNRFSQVVDLALAGEPQHVTRHGQEVVVVVAAETFRRLEQAERLGAPGFVAHLLAMPRDGETFGRADFSPRDVAF